MSDEAKINRIREMRDLARRTCLNHIDVLTVDLTAIVDENERLRDLIGRLVKGLKVWASDEDGVHEGAWDAYADARELLDGKRPCFECGKNPCRDDCNEMVKATP